MTLSKLELRLTCAIADCFSRSAQVVQLTCSAKTWQVRAGELRKINPESVAKTVRRMFDRLDRRGIIAVWVIDAEWRGRAKWHVVVRALACGFQDDGEAAARRVGFSVRVVQDLSTAVAETLAAPEQAPMGLQRAAERRQWLALQAPRARLFRYGVDRHFKRINKHPVTKRAKKAHPYPRQLAPFMYGTHSPRCDCNICKGGGHS